MTIYVWETLQKISQKEKGLPIYGTPFSFFINSWSMYTQVPSMTGIPAEYIHHLHDMSLHWQDWAREHLSGTNVVLPALCIYAMPQKITGNSQPGHNHPWPYAREKSAEYPLLPEIPATAFFFFQDHCCQLQAMPQKTPYVQISRRKWPDNWGSCRSVSLFLFLYVIRQILECTLYPSNP